MICVWIIRDEVVPLTFKWRSFRERKKQVVLEMEKTQSLLQLTFWQITTNITNSVADLTKKSKKVINIDGIITSTLITLVFFYKFSQNWQFCPKKMLFFSLFFVLFLKSSVLVRTTLKSMLLITEEPSLCLFVQLPVCYSEECLFNGWWRTLALKVKVAFELNQSGPSSNMEIRLANWFSADPLVEVFFDPSTHT